VELFGLQTPWSGYSKAELEQTMEQAIRVGNMEMPQLQRLQTMGLPMASEEGVQAMFGVDADAQVAVSRRALPQQWQQLLEVLGKGLSVDPSNRPPLCCKSDSPSCSRPPRKGMCLRHALMGVQALLPPPPGHVSEQDVKKLQREVRAAYRQRPCPFYQHGMCLGERRCMMKHADADSDQQDAPAADAHAQPASHMQAMRSSSSAHWQGYPPDERFLGLFQCWDSHRDNIGWLSVLHPDGREGGTCYNRREVKFSKDRVPPGCDATTWQRGITKIRFSFDLSRGEFAQQLQLWE
jgi:hypothetical protein